MSEKVELISPLQDHQFVESFFELSSDTHFWFKWRFEAFLKQARSLGMPLEEPLRVLDIGAGMGVLRTQVEGATNWTVDITDLDYRALQASDKNVRGETFYYDILEKRPEWQEKYDAILLFDVLEHIEVTEGFVEAILFHLKPGGYLFVNVPAMPLLFSRYDEVQHHFRRYTLRNLEKEFVHSPIEILDTRYWGWVNIPLLLLRRVLLQLFSKGKTDEEIFREGFAPPSKNINAALVKMMQFELVFPAQRIAGSSLLLTGRKKSR